MVSPPDGYLLAAPTTSWLERMGLRWVEPVGPPEDILGPLAGDVPLIALLAGAGALLVIAGFAARGRRA